MAIVRSVILNVVGRDNASASFLKISKAADAAANSTDRAILRMQANSARMQAVGQKMTKAITLPVIAAAAASVYEAAKFQKSMTLIETATGELHSNMSVVSKGVLDVAKSTGTGLTSLGEGMYMVEKAGFRGAAGIKVLKAAAQGAKAENVDLGTATSALTSIMTSYHMSADQAVQAENMLIRGSGLAKTTMTDFASSLSNIVPLASALGISFPQVAGAIDTMTQHGETAQRATENLANLVTNLAGQNNVAAGAMQQLGINTVDLQQHLGERGISGTLKVVLDAMDKSSKGGMVVVGTFRKAALATQSLNQMMAGMDPVVRKGSKALLDGSMTVKQYQYFAKGMGGQAGASALQFLALYKSTLGFSQLIKSGRGDVATKAKELQLMLGGVTGLKTALMLSGGSAQLFTNNIDAVAAAGKLAGADVLGWAKTHETLSNRIDRAKASLQVLAVEIGTALIPVVEKMVGWVTSGVHWFEGLSKTDKKIVGWSIVVIAALGPVMAILGRVGKLIAVMWGTGVGLARFIGGLFGANVALATTQTKAFRFGEMMRRNMTGPISGVRALGSALGGLAIGMSTGYFARGMSDGKRALVGLGTVAASTALGFAVGGPLGAAIGGVTGLVSYLGTVFTGSGDSAKKAAAVARQALQQQKADAADLLETLKSVNGAYGEQYKESIASKLLKGGTLNLANAAGMSPADIVNATLGDQAALGRINAQGAIDSRGKPEYDKKGKLLGYDYDPAAAAAADKIGKAIMALGGSAIKSEKDFELYQKSLNKGILTTTQLAGGLKSLKGELDGTGTALTTSTDYEAKHSAAALHNTEVVRENVEAFGKLADKQIASGKSAFTAATGFYKNEDALRKQLVALGFNKDAVDALIASERTLPKSVTTALKKVGVTPSEIQKIYDKYHSLPKGWVTAVTKKGVTPEQIQAITDKWLGLREQPPANLTVKTNVPEVWNQLTSLYNAILHPPTPAPLFGPSIPGVTVPGLIGAGPNKAAGGPLPEGWFTVGEQGYELGHKSGGRVHIYDNKTSQKMTGMSRVPGFAGGTAGSSAQADQQALAKSLGGGSQANALAAALSGGSSSSSASDAASKAASDAAARASQIRSDQDAIASFLAAARSTASSADELASAAKTLTDAAYQTKVSAGEQSRLARDSAVMAKLSRARDAISARLGTAPTAPTAYDRLGTAQGAYNDSKDTTRQAVMGSFDVTTAGQNSWGVSTTAGIIGAITKAAANAARFATLVKRLAKEGLNRHLIEQLTAAGPSALGAAEALAKATPAQLRTINSSYKSITNTGYSLGKAVADDFYLAGVKSAEAIVKGLLTKRSLLNKTITGLGYAMVISLQNAIGVKAGLVAKPKLTAAEKKIEQSFHIYGITDPEALAIALARRLGKLMA